MSLKIVPGNLFINMTDGQDSLKIVPSKLFISGGDPAMVAEFTKEDHYNEYEIVSSISDAKVVWYLVPASEESEAQLAELEQALASKKKIVLSGKRVGSNPMHKQVDERFSEHWQAITWLTCSDSIVHSHTEDVSHYLCQ